MTTARPDPTVTLVLVSYKQKDFIEEAVRGVLAQACDPIEIIISDDCSPDETYERACSVIVGYAGPHHVRTRRNETNLGLIGHVNLMMELATGELLVVAAGDDVSFPHRVSAILDAWRRSDGKAGAFFSNAIVVDRDGTHRGLRFGALDERRLELRTMARLGPSTLLGATSAWDRRVYSVFGSITGEVTAEDRVIAFRGALLGGIDYIAEPLVYYRMHGDNISLNSIDQIRDGRHYLALVRRHADEHEAQHTSGMKDLARARDAGYRTDGEFLELSRSMARNLAEARSEAAMFEMGRFGRAVVMLRHLVTGTRPQRVARWFLWFIVPDLYVKRLKLQRTFRVWRTKRAQAA